MFRLVNVERQLAVRLEDQSRATTENDLRDIAARHGATSHWSTLLWPRSSS